VVKLPGPPDPATLQLEAGDIRQLIHEVMWRIHPTVGGHVLAWNELRRWGPVPNTRFDPHLSPPRLQNRGVMYCGLAVPDVLAEVFQQTRIIRPSARGVYLTGWQAIRPLRLLDLTGKWPVRAGASHAINTGRKDHTRAWAAAIHTAWPDLDGLWHHSAMTGGPLVALFTHAADSFPARPDLSVPLTHPDLSITLLDAAHQIGYGVV
jgi:hypothetical protein